MKVSWKCNCSDRKNMNIVVYTAREFSIIRYNFDAVIYPLKFFLKGLGAYLHGSMTDSQIRQSLTGI